MTARARHYLQTAVAELMLGYLVGAMVFGLSDFLGRMLSEHSGPVLDELFLVRFAFLEVMLSPLVALHAVLYLGAKFLRAAAPERLGWLSPILYMAAAIAFTFLWDLAPTPHDLPERGQYAFGFYLFGLPFLVLALSGWFILPRVEERIARENDEPLASAG